MDSGKSRVVACIRTLLNALEAFADKLNARSNNWPPFWNYSDVDLAATYLSDQHDGALLKRESHQLFLETYNFNQAFRKHSGPLWDSVQSDIKREGLTGEIAKKFIADCWDGQLRIIFMLHLDPFIRHVEQILRYVSESVGPERKSSSEKIKNPSGKIAEALEFIKNRERPVKGVTIARHIGVAESTFHSHYVPVLKKHGVANDGDGYFFNNKPAAPT